MNDSYWEITHGPDLEETGIFQFKTYVKTTWVGPLSQQYVEKSVVEDFCYSRFGPKVVYGHSTFAFLAWMVKMANSEIYKNACPIVWAAKPTKTVRVALKIGGGEIILLKEEILV